MSFERHRILFERDAISLKRHRVSFKQCTALISYLNSVRATRFSKFAYLHFCKTDPVSRLHILRFQYLFHSKIILNPLCESSKPQGRLYYSSGVHLWRRRSFSITDLLELLRELLPTTSKPMPEGISYVITCIFIVIRVNCSLQNYSENKMVLPLWGIFPQR